MCSACETGDAGPLFGHERGERFTDMGDVTWLITQRLIEPVDGDVVYQLSTSAIIGGEDIWVTPEELGRYYDPVD